MKKVIVLSEKQFIELMESNSINENNVETYDDVCFISIHGSENDYRYFKSNHSNVLNSYFDDIVEELPDTKQSYNLFTDEQSDEIYNFIYNNRQKKTFIIHCSAGISRSGAVGEFIVNFLNLDYNKFISLNKFVKPNNRVLSKLNKHLWL